MDGTLTHGIHDFEAIRKALGLEPGAMILETIDNMPAAEARQMHEKLFELEKELALQATPQPGAQELLAALKQRGCQLGVLTRNSEELAEITLGAVGLLGYFERADIIGRERCAPKPDPAGAVLLMQKWGARPENTIVVGDYLFDLQVGRAAGVCTVHFDVNGRFQWPEETDIQVTRLSDVLSCLEHSVACQADS